MSGHFRVPFFVADFPDALQGLPQLDAMGHLRLKRSQFRARIFGAFAAEVDAPASGAGYHRALLAAEIASFFRSAAMACQFPDWKPVAFRQHLQPLRLLVGSDVQVARRAKQPAYGGPPFVRLSNMPSGPVTHIFSSPFAVFVRMCAATPNRSSVTEFNHPLG
jgi:hypothetical protein